MAVRVFSRISRNDDAVAPKDPRRREFKRRAAYEWTVTVLYAALDILAWIVLYGIITYVRGDTFYETRMGFLVIDLIQLGVIMQALYIIGGYDRNVDKRTLSYAVEHILAIAAAAVFSAMVIYSAATLSGAWPSISARHLARLSPSGSTRAAVRALATASAACPDGISPASAGRITRFSIAR